VELRILVHHHGHAVHQQPTGSYGGNPLAVDIFALNVLLAVLATQATLLFGQRRQVLIAPVGVEVRATGARVTVVVLVLAVSVGLPWVNTGAAKWCWVLILLAPQAANRWAARPGSGANAAGAPGR
jgi:hypothetical protein